MWGWKAAERRIEPSVTLEQAKTIMKGAGFSEHIANPEHAIFRRAGTQLAVVAANGKTAEEIQAAIDELTRKFGGNLRQWPEFPRALAEAGLEPPEHGHRAISQAMNGGTAQGDSPAPAAYPDYPIFPDGSVLRLGYDSNGCFKPP